MKANAYFWLIFASKMFDAFLRFRIAEERHKNDLDALEDARVEIVTDMLDETKDVMDEQHTFKKNDKETVKKWLKPKPKNQP